MEWRNLKLLKKVLVILVISSLLFLGSKYILFATQKIGGGRIEKEGVIGGGVGTEIIEEALANYTGTWEVYDSLEEAIEKNYQTIKQGNPNRFWISDNEGNILIHLGSDRKLYDGKEWESFNGIYYDQLKKQCIFTSQSNEISEVSYFFDDTNKIVWFILSGRRYKYNGTRCTVQETINFGELWEQLNLKGNIGKDIFQDGKGNL